MPNDRRGQYVARFSDYEGDDGECPITQATKWHYVDSQAGDHVVTYCGREMKLKLWTGALRFSTMVGGDMCALCSEASLADG